MKQALRRQALRAPVGTRSAVAHQARTAILPPLARSYSSAPTIAQTSFWKSLIPKPWRPREKRPDVYFGPPKTLKKPKKDWNPATFYIVIFLFIGSMSIQMISLRNDFNTHMRRAETRIGILREVIEKLQRGEEVDVEKELGTGDAEKEQEWEQGWLEPKAKGAVPESRVIDTKAVLKEIERDDAIRAAKKSDRPKHSSGAKAEAKEPKADAPGSQQNATSDKPKAATVNYSGFF
ncbi:hypothetical protein JX265_002353 [Neoarthrinium moseri]|uniref:Uncharacterized protein n=1 Tax=Neoarthrinium moseri TaxID=1658444 RepID=A0A9Q0AQB9_9PEZI|nr:hypothetical protein JX265_002353 [Neoarthrinium moseri]